MATWWPTLLMGRSQVCNDTNKIVLFEKYVYFGKHGMSGRDKKCPLPAAAADTQIGHA